MGKTHGEVKEKQLCIAYFELIFIAFIWGTSTVLMKKYINEIPTFHIMLTRFGIGALVVFLASPKKIATIGKNDLKIGILLGLLIFGSYAFFILGLVFTSASKTGFLASLSVLFIPIIQTIISKKAPSKWTMMSIIFSVLGLYLMSGMNGTGTNIGDFLVIIGALCYTTYIILLGKLGKSIDEYRLTFIQLTLTFIISLFLAIFYEGLDLSVIKNNIFVLLLIGAVGTGLTTFMQAKAQKVASPESVGILLLFEPITTMILAFFFLKETISLKGFLGSLLVLISLIVAIVKKI